MNEVQQKYSPRRRSISSSMRGASGCSKMAVDDFGTFLCRHSQALPKLSILHVIYRFSLPTVTYPWLLAIVSLSASCHPTTKFMRNIILSQAYAIRPLTPPAAPMRLKSSSLFEFIHDAIISWSWLDWLSLEKIRTAKYASPSPGHSMMELDSMYTIPLLLDIPLLSLNSYGTRLGIACLRLVVWIWQPPFWVE